MTEQFSEKEWALILDVRYHKALRAVMVLHKLSAFGNCDLCVEPYPCPTMQVIEKELDQDQALERKPE